MSILSAIVDAKLLEEMNVTVFLFVSLVYFLWLSLLPVVSTDDRSFYCLFLSGSFGTYHCVDHGVSTVDIFHSVGADVLFFDFSTHRKPHFILHYILHMS